MKRCVVISCYVVNAYRKSLVQGLIDTFNKANIDVILASSDHIPNFSGVKNYITCKNIRNENVLSDGLKAYFSAAGMTFYRVSDSNIYTGYFFRLYQIVTAYAKNLGYEYMYFIDQDMVLREDYAEKVLSNDIDITKVHAYQLSEIEDYQVTFFHGNINILSGFFSDDSINHISTLSKTRYIANIETAFAIIAKDHPNLVLHKKEAKEIFSKINLFSSSNLADVYFDSKNKRYLFLHAKGDISPDSVFSTELILDGKVVYSNTHSHVGAWNLMQLEPFKQYAIRYYDAHISPDTLYKTTSIYTDINKPTTSYYVEYL